MKVYKDPAQPELGVIDEVDYCQLLARLKMLEQQIQVLMKFNSLVSLGIKEAKRYESGKYHNNRIALTDLEYQSLEGLKVELFWRLAE